MTTSSHLASGITVLERGWLSSNNVIFVDGTTAVVDTGYLSHSVQTVSLVNSVLRGKPLDLIVNTHLHSDHCGGNAALAAAYPSLRILIPPGVADAVARWDEDALTFVATGQSCARFMFDGLLSPGGVVRLGRDDWEILAAPGHDPHSVILFEPTSRTLISADALWANGFGVVFPELDGDGGFADVSATLDMIEALSPRTVIPGHGSVFSGDEVVGALDRARARLAGQVANPERHAAHAMKVLIKFKLLETQSMAFDPFLAWATSMPYMARVHKRFGAATSLEHWIESLVTELQLSGALRRTDGVLHNK